MSKSGRGRVEVIWTKSKRAATFFFGKPSLCLGKKVVQVVQVVQVAQVVNMVQVVRVARVVRWSKWSRWSGASRWSR